MQSTFENPNNVAGRKALAEKMKLSEEAYIKCLEAENSSRSIPSTLLTGSIAGFILSGILKFKSLPTCMLSGVLVTVVAERVLAASRCGKKHLVSIDERQRIHKMMRQREKEMIRKKYRPEQVEEVNFDTEFDRETSMSDMETIVSDGDHSNIEYNLSFDDEATTSAPAEPKLTYDELRQRNREKYKSSSQPENMPSGNVIPQKPVQPEGESWQQLPEPEETQIRWTKKSKYGDVWD